MSSALEPSRHGYPAAPMPPGPMIVDQEGDADGVNLLEVAWRSRWLIVLMTLLGGAGAWAFLQRVTPRYTSVARVYVEQSTPRLLANDSALAGSSTNFLYTQAEWIRSTTVLDEAASVLSDLRLDTFRDVDEPVAFLLEELIVQVGDRDDLIYISVELPNATDSAEIVNQVVDAYKAEYMADRSGDVERVLKILIEERDRANAKLDADRQAVEEFREQHVNLAVQTSDNNNVITQLFSGLAAELNATQIQLIEAKARYNRAKGLAENPDRAPYLVSLAMAEQAGSEISDLQTQAQRIEQALTAERIKWGDGYPGVKLLQDSLDAAQARYEEKRANLVTGYVDNLKLQFELLVQRRDELQNAYDKQFQLAAEVSADAAKLASLEDAYQRTERYCELLDDRVQEVELDKSSGELSVSVIDYAAPGTQTYPEKPKVLAIGLAIGGMLGFGLAWLRDLLDQRLKSVDEIASVMQLPVIGALPVIAGLRGENGRSDGGRLVADQPRSPAAEAVRTLRTALHFGIAGAESKVFVVTSPAPGDGKSTVASNLAIAMAQSEQRVLLIDADMRKPTQHEIFSIEAKVGLAAVLSGTQAPQEAIQATDVSGLDVLPCGKRPPNPVELLTNGVLAEALSVLCEQYDRIIIDSPPVMPVADARLIGAMADCTVLVLRAERSTRRFSVAARDELLKVRAQRLGLVVNAAPMHRSGYSYGSYGGYGQGVYGYAEDDRPSDEPRRKPRLKGPQRESEQLSPSDA